MPTLASHAADLRPHPLAVLVVVLAGCSKSTTPPAPTVDATSGDRPRYGAVMAEIGQRFESAGRAAVAHRFELAAFEIGELDEALSGDLPRAELPKEGPSAQLPAMAKEFGGTHPPALVKAAEQHDGAAFAAAFARAAAACNACHAASEHGFIEIPSIPGKSVPDFEPLPPSGSASVTP